MIQRQYAVRRIERISEDSVRLTLVAPEGPEMIRSEHIIDVPVDQEVPTGTKFDVTYTLAGEDE